MSIDLTSSVDTGAKMCVRQQRRSSMMEVLLPYGKGSDGRLLHISEVSSGLKCDCKCPSCDALLVAKRGRIMEHHFAHYGTATCRHALETTLHKLAKQVVEDQCKVLLPEVRAVVGDEERIVHESRLFDVDEVSLEHWLEGMRPDIVAKKAGRELLIEIAVTHRCDEKKKALICERGIAAIEIDLSGLPRDASKADIENAILSSAPRQWIYNRRLDEAVAKLTSDRDKRATEIAERKVRKIRADAERLVTSFRQGSPKDAAAEVLKATAPMIAEIQDTKLVSVVGIDVGGDGCFIVGRGIWQAVILRHIILKSWTDFRLIAKDVVQVLGERGLIKRQLTGFVDPELAEAARQKDRRFLSPYETVTAYLEWLCHRTILTKYREASWTTETAAIQGARAAIKEAEKRRQRVERIRQALKSLLNSIPDGNRFSADSWMERRLPRWGMSPIEMAARGDDETYLLADHLRELQRMCRGFGGVEEDLFGLPLEEFQENRRRVIAEETRSREEKRREQAERERLAAAEKARRYAKSLRESIISEAYSALGPEEGAHFLNARRECLGNLSVLEIEGLEQGQSDIVMSTLNTLTRRIHREWAEAHRVGDIQDKLQRAAEAALGVEMASLWLGSGHPALSLRRPRDVAVNDDELHRCVALLPKTTKRHRAR